MDFTKKWQQTKTKMLGLVKEQAFFKFGIMNTPEDTKNCYGNNYATKKRNLVNRFTPDHGVYDREQTNNSDLFIPSPNQHEVPY